MPKMEFNSPEMEFCMPKTDSIWLNSQTKDLQITAWLPRTHKARCIH